MKQTYPVLTHLIQSDFWEGPRFTYALLNRPVRIANIPDGWLLNSAKPYAKYYHGTVDYPYRLPASIVASYEMELVAEQPWGGDLVAAVRRAKDLHDHAREQRHVGLRLTPPGVGAVLQVVGRLVHDDGDEVRFEVEMPPAHQIQDARDWPHLFFTFDGEYYDFLLEEVEHA